MTVSPPWAVAIGALALVGLFAVLMVIEELVYRLTREVQRWH
jgi:hypothetical protein